MSYMAYIQAAAGGIEFIVSSKDNPGAGVPANVPAHNANDTIIVIARRGDSSGTSPGTTTYLDGVGATIATPTPIDTLTFAIAGNGVAVTAYQDTGNVVEQVKSAGGAVLFIFVYRGVSGIGASVQHSEDTGSTATYESLTFDVTDGTSWAFAFVTNNQGAALPDAPTGLVERIQNTSPSLGGGSLAAFDSDGGVTGYTTDTAAMNESAVYATVVIELKD